MSRWIGSQCVAPNGYVIPNNCKQHCSDVPPVDCNTSCVVPTEVWKTSRFNFLDRTPVTPDTCTHDHYEFIAKEFPSAVCVTYPVDVIKFIVVLMLLIVIGIQML